MAQNVAAFVSLLRKTFAPEHLPPPPSTADASRDRSRSSGIAKALFAIERLGTEPEPPRRARRSGLAILFALEPLSRDPEIARPRRRHWLARLFALETLDPPP